MRGTLVLLPMDKAADGAAQASAVVVRALRLHLGLSQEKLAEAAALGRVEVVNIESGRNKASSARVQRGLSQAFGLAPDVLASALAGLITSDQAIEAVKRVTKKRAAKVRKGGHGAEGAPA